MCVPQEEEGPNVLSEPNASLFAEITRGEKENCAFENFEKETQLIL